MRVFEAITGPLYSNYSYELLLSMAAYTIGIVGLGAAARSIHLPAYSKLPELRVVAGADANVNPREFRFPVFPDVERLLVATQPDILAVVTPPERHFEHAKLGLEAGCHVFCEKPFMTNLDEADAIIALSRQTGRMVVVNNQYRFMNIHRAVKERIGQPDFGNLLFLDARQTFYTTPSTEAGWRGQDVRRTCKEFGTHIFDLCRFFFAEDPISIFARMPKGDRPNGPDYLTLVQLEFSGDRVAQITLDRLSRGPHDYLTIRLDGSAGYLESHLGGGLVLSTGIRGGKRVPFVKFDASMGGRTLQFQGERSRKIASDPIDVFAHATSQLLRAFLDGLDRGETPPCAAADNRKTLALMLRAYESSELRRPIMLDAASG
ncbi:MAG: Gfo/Idh/MocA family oxidoreductase [Gemmataceae bacterium]